MSQRPFRCLEERDPGDYLVEEYIVDKKQYSDQLSILVFQFLIDIEDFMQSTI